MRESARKRQLRLRRCDPSMLGDLRRAGGQANGDAQAPVAAPAVSSEELEALRAEAAQQKDAHLRARADLDNMRKRAQKEREELRKFAIQEVVRDILPAIDNFERAIASRNLTHNVASFAEGVEMIFTQLVGMLQTRGVERYDPKGQPFDPQFHEAVQTLPPPTPAQDNTVLETLQPGWTLNGRVVRPAMVVIAKSA